MSEEALQRALAAHRRGDLLSAEAGYRAILSVEPTQADAHALLGVALDALGRQGEALESIRRAIALDPKAALFYIHLGNVLAATGDWQASCEAFRKAAQLQPNFPDVHYNLGNVLRESGDWESAEKAYQQALALTPEHVLARNNLALVYEHQERLGEAVALLEEVVALAPEYKEGWLNLSSLAEKNKDYERALEAAAMARDLAPDQPKPWFGLGVALSRMGRDEEALTAYLKAVEIGPDWAALWDNIGQTYQLLGRLDEAEAAFRRCIDRDGQTILDEENRRVEEKEYGGRHWHLALLQLLKGDYKQGFSRYRARFKDVKGLARETWPRPIWQGEDLADKTLLVMDEQGMGDCLMMVRYLPLLKERGAKVLFLVAKALVPLFKGWAFVDHLIPRGEKIPDFDFYASIFDLPYVFGTTLDTVPSRVPYLPILELDEKTVIQGDGRLKIGVVWAGTPLHKHDQRRSLTLSVFKEIFEEKNFQFFSFNRDKREGDDEIVAQSGIVDLAPKLDNFADSSRFMRQMDLVISCDTATAHLAGGLGVPVWTLLPFAPDWRWLMDREDSPWYPTMRLFRQEKPGDWQTVMKRVRSALTSRTDWSPSNLSAND